MQILPLTTGILKEGDDFASVLAAFGLRDGDIAVLSSKAVAVIEGCVVPLKELPVSAEAKAYAGSCGRSEAFCEAVLRETKRLNGSVIGTCPSALLTLLKPTGMTEGALLVPNAGMDESNIAQGFAAGWPHDPVASLRRIRERLGVNVGLILTDSCCVPLRNGVTAFALACVGIDPFKSEIGSEDLFGRKLRVTVEAVADQLAVAGNSVMGNTSQAAPAALIRDHGFPLSDYEGWVNGMDPARDLFKDAFQGLS
jgi:coenzyme F420-0:L-glutamate ligase / coenzyme F420-1:gamma-L-glutamate ligase